MLGLRATARTASEGTPGEGGWSGEEHGGETEAATRPWEACSSAQVRAQDQNKTKKPRHGAADALWPLGSVSWEGARVTS